MHRSREGRALTAAFSFTSHKSANPVLRGCATEACLRERSMVWRDGKASDGHRARDHAARRYSAALLACASNGKPRASRCAR